MIDKLGQKTGFRQSSLEGSPGAQASIANDASQANNALAARTALVAAQPTVADLLSKRRRGDVTNLLLELAARKSSVADLLSRSGQ
jgi:hypothetical protein